MPYTLSHPAAVLLVGRVRGGRATGNLPVPLAAAVAGSMAPDLPYYLTLPGPAVQSHGLVGLFTLDLLLGLAMYFIWVGLVLGPAIWLAPAAVQRRVPEHCRIGLAVRLESPMSLLTIVLCVLLGSTTHLVWDSFTHSGMWATIRWPALNATVSGHTMYTWLQFTSSILGLALIGRALVMWWLRTPPVAPLVPGSRVWRILTAVCLIVIPLGESLRAFRRTIGVPFGWSWISGPAKQPAIIEALVGGTKVGLALILFFSLLWHLQAQISATRRRHHSLEPPSRDSETPGVTAVYQGVAQGVARATAQASDRASDQAKGQVADQLEPALARTSH